MAYSGPAFADVAAFFQKHAPDPEADRTVTAKVETAADLADLLTGQLRKVHALAPARPMGWQALTCAADVGEALAKAMRPAGPGPGAFMPAPGGLIEIPVIISADSAPGTDMEKRPRHPPLRAGAGGARLRKVLQASEAFLVLGAQRRPGLAVRQPERV